MSGECDLYIAGFEKLQIRFCPVTGEVHFVSTVVKVWCMEYLC